MRNNIFQIEDNPSETSVLIVAALEGDKKALEMLIKEHQDYIYNISLRLFLDPDDALDATQEVLIKVITNLKTFKGESNFKTWLYRIAFNHFLSSPHRKMEKYFAGSIEKIGLDIAIEGNNDDVPEELKEEVRMLCSTAMLMCLDREQRLLYIIGEVFNADHNLGAALFDISPANYRVKLHRAKADLMSFVTRKCGLINPDNPCRCHKKTKQMINAGQVNKDALQFNTSYTEKINELVESKRNEVSDQIQFEMQELFRDSPFQIKKELDILINTIVS